MKGKCLNKVLQTRRDFSDTDEIWSVLEDLATEIDIVKNEIDQMAVSSITNFFNSKRRWWKFWGRKRKLT